MLDTAHRLACPNCGGPVEFRIGASRGAICPYCRFSIARLTDDTLVHGERIADLVPTNPPFDVGDRVRIEGRDFVVLGRQQLDHGAGPWDELYVGTETDDVGWLALAQGRWLFTRAKLAEALPAVSSLVIGAPITSGPLSGLTTFERGHYRVISAIGELPLPIHGGDAGEHADLEGAGGVFATLDEDNETRRLYVGNVLAEPPVLLSRGQHPIASQAAPAPEARKLRCGGCGAPIAITMPGTTERVGCEACGAILDLTGSVIQALAADRLRRAGTGLPIGAEGTLRGERCRVVGYIRKSCVVEGTRYPWEEYLLATAKGFLWLTEENGHCTLYVDALRGDVTEFGNTIRYHGRTYHEFSGIEATVEAVVGELTYKVVVGERTYVAEHIDPPNSVSKEKSASELTYSYGTYVPAREVYEAFGVVDRTPLPHGVGTTQPAPFPHVVLRAAVLFGLLVVAQLWLMGRASELTIARTRLELPFAAYATDPGASSPVVTLIEELVVPDTRVVTVQLVAPGLSNGWVETEMTLINRENGETYELSAIAEQYSGVTDGEYWTEGDSGPTVRISRVPKGRYTLRAESIWGVWPSWIGPGSPPLPEGLEPSLIVGTERGGLPFFMSAGLLLLPFFIAFNVRASFIKRRWDESNFSLTGSV